MERTIPSYIESTCSGDFEILEEIFEDKYTEFLECYWLLKEYSEFITNISYEKHKKNLELDVFFKKLKTSDIIENLMENIPITKKIHVSSSNKAVHLIFYKKND